MKWLILCALFLSALLRAPAGSAQTRDPFSTPGGPGAPETYGTRGSTLFLKVFNQSRAQLDRQAVVKLLNKTTQDVAWQTTTLDSSEAGFGDLQVGQYDIEVSAVGYLTAHKELMVGTAMSTYREEIALQPDPSAVDLNAALASEIPARARKETQRGVTALKSGDYKQAQKRLESAYKIAPTSTDVNFFLGYLFLQQKNLDLAKNYLGRAANLDPHNVQALTSLGRLSLGQQDYKTAQMSLEQAVAANGDYWMAHKLLAETYLKQREYDKAREQALLAMAKGNGAAGDAGLVLGQALGNLGHDQEAIQALQTYLQNTPSSPQGPQVRDLIAFFERRAANPNSTGEAAPKIVSSPETSDSLTDTDNLRLSMKTWLPPGVDDMKPSVATDVSCPYEKVIHQSGVRVKELVDNVGRFQAIEELVHERVDELGHPTSRDTREFNYIAEISESDPGFLAVNEYRGSHSGLADFPDLIATRGLPALALIFHPVMRENFQLVCEGLGDW
jgi:tetratricopeptide (TPR) repeat protein